VATKSFLVATWVWQLKNFQLPHGCGDWKVFSRHITILISITTQPLVFQSPHNHLDFDHHNCMEFKFDHHLMALTTFGHHWMEIINFGCYS
jgi:hypothetical protein